MTTTLAPPGWLVRTLEPYLKLPEGAPHVPLGAGSPRAFRASIGFLRYRYLTIVAALLVEVPLLVPLVGASLAKSWILAAVVLLLGLLVAAALLSVLYAATRLDYDLRQYLVTDRALRIRSGALVVREVTITYANVQDVEIRQGPLQRFFKISDLVVHTAGGSSSPKAEGGGGTSHRGALQGIDDPKGVRDLILARLRAYRDAGLGDPDDRGSALAAAPVRASQALALDGATLQRAASELRAAARELVEACGAARG